MTDSLRQRQPDALVAAMEGGRLRALFDALSPDAAHKLFAQFKICNLAAGTVVIPEGSTANEVGFVLRGSMGMVKLLPDGRRHIIGLLVPTDRFGRIFDGPSSFRIEALSDVQLLCIDRRLFEDALRAEPEAERRMLVHLLDELDAAREWVLLISGTRVIERVASFLLILLRRSDPPAGGAGRIIVQPLSRRDLAHFLGTRRESISRALHTLQDEGTLRIVTHEKFEILDVERLVAMGGQDLVLDEFESRRA
jgi:CRP/FNR family transcriptional regulator, anaerobic regulatory protein